MDEEMDFDELCAKVNKLSSQLDFLGRSRIYDLEQKVNQLEQKVNELTIEKITKEVLREISMQAKRGTQ